MIAWSKHEELKNHVMKLMYKKLDLFFQNTNQVKNSHGYYYSTLTKMLIAEIRVLFE